MVSFCIGHTTRLGVVMLAATERGICFLQFGDAEDSLHAELLQKFPSAVIVAASALAIHPLGEWMATLHDYLDEKKPLQHLPLDVRGTSFQMQVWRYLQTIPAGQVRSYAQVACAIGKPAAARAVASACARNQIALIIPCHRVLRGDGGLAGYRWGIERKRALLDLEQRAIPSADGLKNT
jgi:AraC family transcriptional regulator, regulatory protein of adaptative response / methylated-DNA-[protein]-cysteine methyltransferase